MAMNEAKYREAEELLWDSFGLKPIEHRLPLATIGSTVRVREVGDGPPVVLVHGASVDGGSWVQLVERLSQFRCIVVDRPGCGLSEPLPKRHSDAVENVKWAADHLVPDVLDALDVPKAHVFGNSYGGFFSLRAAAAAPDRVDRVVLYSWSLGVPTETTPFVLRLAGMPGLGELTARMPITRTGAKMILRQVGLKAVINSGKFTDGMLDWFVALLRNTPTVLNEVRAIPKVITPIAGINKAMLFTDDELARVTSPVYMFWGEDDPNGGAATAKEFVERVPNGTLELVPNAGHAPWIDEIDQATTSTRDFLMM